MVGIGVAEGGEKINFGGIFTYTKKGESPSRGKGGENCLAP